MTTQYIKLTQLAKSSLNVRKTASATADEELKASIAAHGLMQNLVVIPASKGKFEVIAGGRRLEALRQLQAEGNLPERHEVPCRVADAAEAAELSLAENTVRQAMHPADEHAAYTALIDSGTSIEAISQRFGKSRKHVEQRLKLGRAAPELIQAYRNGEITLEVLEAYTVTDDHTRQIQVYESLKGSWDADEPSEIRSHLTERMVSGNDKRVNFVGLDTYEKAGGGVKRDLFGEEVFLENPELLDALLAEKLKLARAELEAEGWAWVAVTHERDWNVTSGCKRIQPAPLNAPQELLDQVTALEAEFEALETEWEAAEEEETVADIRERRGEAHRRKNALQEQLEAYLCFTPEQITSSGCYAYIGHSGDFEIERGLMKREEAKAITKDGGNSPESALAEKPKGLPESLKADLEAYRLSAAQAEIAKSPALAFDLLVFKATKEMCGCGYARDGAQVIFTRNCGGVKASSEARRWVDNGLKAIEVLLPLEWLEVVGEAEQFAAFQKLTAEHKHQLLAFCVASSLQPKLLEGEPETAYDIALAQTGANVAYYWRPSATSFLNRVKTSDLLAITEEIFGANFAASRSGSKKTALVSELDRAFRDPENQICTEELKNWLPKGMAFGELPSEPKPAKAKKGKKAA